MKLYDFYHSSAAYRVRIALNLKGISVEREYINLTEGKQRTADYAAVNPQQLVPALVLDNGEILTQSLAILEYLDEAFPTTPKLLPADAVGRAHTRALAYAVAEDIAPINNLKIRKRLSTLGLTDEQVKSQWIQHWIADGFTGIEALLARSALTGKFCVGDTPTIADCCLVPQMFNAHRWGVDVSPFPTIRHVVDACEAHPAFIAAQPSKQPDAPKAAA